MKSTEQSNHDAQGSTFPAGPTVNPDSEDRALALLQDPNLNTADIASLAKSPVVAQSRKVLLALVTHPGAPRHISIPLLRRMFTFDLMQVALTPTAAPDLKRQAEEQILLRSESLSAGEKTTLAKCASGRIAAALLQDRDSRVIAPAMDNSHLTEALVVQALMKPRAPEALFKLASEHKNWSLRREVQIALLRSEKTPIERARKFARNFREEFLREILPEKTVEELIGGNQGHES